jgi:hypothetical protein
MDKQQARDSLDVIFTARRRAGELRNYRDSGSIILVWGIAWLLGFGAQQFFVNAAPVIWIMAWVGALGWTITRPRNSNDGRTMATWLVALAFIFLLLAVTNADERLAGMIFGLVLAASYAALGIWAGKRFLALAAVVLVTACVSWWLYPQWLFGFLALGGGGGLIVGGAWLRRP